VSTTLHDKNQPNNAVKAIGVIKCFEELERAKVFDP
jgi:hypothetical protein